MNKVVNYNINKKIILFLLVSYSIICSLIIGNSWDINPHLQQGKSTFNYLLSFGKINNDTYVNLREFNSPSYWTIVYFITQFFPKSIELEIFKLINLIISWLSLIGFYKLGKILYNKHLGYIFLLNLYFYPIFFGHTAINPKDTILLFCHIWIVYLGTFYLKKQNINYDLKKTLYKVGILIAIGSGIQLYFIASLFPFFIFIFLEIFFFKKFINNNFNILKFFKDLFIIFFIFYFIFIFFWIDAHDNILIKPIELFRESFDAQRGWPLNIVNGKIFYTKETPFYYIFITLLNKSPEYILYLYIFFIIFFYKIDNFFTKKNINFKYLLIFFIFLISYPNLILLFNPFGVYDGIRLFLWVIPYLLIIPSLTLYYLIKNFDQVINKVNFIITVFMMLYYLFIFLAYTPYQYTYLNFLTSTPQEKETKFENDYWGVSIKELFKKIKIEFKINENEKIKVFLCGVPGFTIKKHIKKNNLYFLDIVEFKDADYIISNNKTYIKDLKNPKLELCNNYVDKKIISVERLNHSLSIFGKLKK